MKVRGFKLAAIKTNTLNDHGNKKNQVMSLETSCFVSNVKHVQDISLGCAPREIYFSFLKGEYLLNTQSRRAVFLFIKQIEQNELQ